MNSLLTVDPGWNTGWAYWNNSRFPRTGEIRLKGKYIKLEDKLNFMWGEFDVLITELRPKSLLMEGVGLWGSSAKSFTSASRGDLFRLAYLLGGYCNLADNFRIEYGIIDFKDWGGQLTAEAVRAWVKRVTGKTFESQHITDAVGMGLSFFERFNKHELRKV